MPVMKLGHCLRRLKIQQQRLELALTRNEQVSRRMKGHFAVTGKVVMSVAQYPRAVRDELVCWVQACYLELWKGGSERRM